MDIIGNWSDDNIGGTEDADTIHAREGNDTVTGLGGNDHIWGEDGNDFLIGNGGNDTIDGGSGNDTIWGGDWSDFLFGGGGNDWIEGGYGNDTIDGGFGFDTASYETAANAVTVSLAIGGPQATGGAGNDSLNDIEALYGSRFNDWLYGSDKANNLNGFIGADSMAGGPGDDTYVIDNAGDVVFENADEGFDVVQSAVSYTLPDYVERLTLRAGPVDGTGNDQDNQINGTSEANILRGLGGNDLLWSADGDDSLYGGDGADTLKAGNGDDYLDGGAGDDVMIGSAGNDTYVVDSLGDDLSMAEWAYGGWADTVLLAGAINFALPTYFENLTLLATAGSGTAVHGNAADNVIVGNAFANSIFGDGGNDRLDGGGGIDTLYGGPGNDVYVIDNLDDAVVETPGGGGDVIESTISYTRLLPENVETLRLVGFALEGRGNDLANGLFGTPGVDHLYGLGGADNLYGNGGSDYLEGGAGADSLTGEAGWDELHGGADADYLLGGNGNDRLYGEDGNDILVGGRDFDLLVGGAGADVFTFQAASDTGIGTVQQSERIDDFSRADGDKIDLSAVFGASTGHFIGTAAFSHAPGEVRYDAASASYWAVSVDLNGDGSADMKFLVNKVPDLIASDFAL